ncbi:MULTISPECIES: BolA family protein [Candidatus Ichthyocystis]|uniref:BolA family protein n=1 Tax=Candidatus Ichthyocystis TaxID=2929841 RepID=UPI000B84997B|nr:MULTISPECIES: BolA/IbaG family iron-sulfur metabolism protein [Ichthyocystis]
MTPDNLRSCIVHILDDDGAFVTVEGDDGRHFHAVVVSHRFDGMSLINRHRLIMNSLSKQISSDLIHALSLRTFTHSEWEKRGK